MIMRFLGVIVCLVYAINAYALNPQSYLPSSSAVTPEQTLVQILEDETLRSNLITKLKSTAVPEAKSAVSSHPIAHLISEMNKTVADGFAFLIAKTEASSLALAALWQHVSYEWVSFFKFHSSIDLMLAVVSFVLVITLALAVRWGLNKIAKDTLLTISEKRLRGDWYPYQAVTVRSFIDLSNSSLAWFVSYVFVMLVIQKGWLGDVMHHFLMSYLIFSIALVVVKILFSPYYEPLRVLSLDNVSAQKCYKLLRLFLAYIIFGVLFATSLIASTGVEVSMINPYQELMISLLVLWLLCLVWRYRLPVADAIKPLSDSDSLERLSGVHLLRMKVSSVWHWVASFYLVIMLWAWLFDFEQTFSHQIKSSIFTIFLLLGFLSMRWIVEHVEAWLTHLIKQHKHDLPYFCKRAKTLVKSVKLVMQLLVVALAWLIFLAIWRLVDLDTLYLGSFWQHIVIPFSELTVTVFFALVIWLFLLTLIEYKLIDSQKAHPRFAKDNDTLLHLLRNVITIATILVTGIIVLADMGVHVGPLIAGAGILSLAIGFGAQTLVKDVINGLFNIIEGTLKVGSWVKINGQEGWVERVTLRTVSLRNNQTGTLSIVPFSSVSMVENFTKGYAFYYTSIEVAYRENYDHVAEVLHQVGKALQKDDSVKDEIMSPLEIRGLSTFEANGYKISCRIKTMPGRQRVVGRVFNRLVKQYFDSEGITFPFPTRTIHLVKDGPDTKDDDE